MICAATIRLLAFPAWVDRIVSGRSRLAISDMPCARLSRWMLALALVSVSQLVRTVAQNAAATSCNISLLAPAADTAIAFPQSFSWSVNGSCPNSQLAFATTGNLPDLAYVPDTILNPATISQEDWALVKGALDPAGVIEELYWNVVAA